MVDNGTEDRAPHVLIANGVNLDLLGRRERGIYGQGTLLELEDLVRQKAPEIAQMVGLTNIDVEFFQSNSEAEFLRELSKPWDGAVINPGAWTHTSLALADRLAGLELSFVEVHISHVAQREAFRQHSYCAASALGVVSGLGFAAYLSGLLGLLAKLKNIG